MSEATVINEMLGKVFKAVNQHGNEILEFETEDGMIRFEHRQDCCESVYIEDVCGDLSDLVGRPITQAERVTNTDPVPNREWQPESHLWTFYKFATAKGGVTVRWLGESNGYYSERVSACGFGEFEGMPEYYF